MGLISEYADEARKLGNAFDVAIGEDGEWVRLLGFGYHKSVYLRKGMHWDEAQAFRQRVRALVPERYRIVVV